MKEVKSVGFHIPDNDENFIRLDSFSSIADADIVIFSPDLSITKYSTKDNYSNERECQGKSLYNKETSALIQEHSTHWKKELSDFVVTGRTLFIVLPPKIDFYIYSGTKTISGTGKNQRSIENVFLFSNYDYLPFSFLEFHNSTGKYVVPKSSLINELFINFKDLISYEVYLKSQKDLKGGIFSTKKGDRVLGATFKIKDGNVVLLPHFEFGDNKFTKFNRKTNKYTWTEEAIKRGKILTNLLVGIDKTLKSEKAKSPKPNWIDLEEFTLEKANETKKNIKHIETEIQTKNNELIELNKALEEEESLQDLLYETGKPLENSVIKGLRILGYTAENYNDGELELDQIILSPEGHRYIGECEGKDNKDIDVTKFRQLLDGLNADFEKEHVTEKAFGLLFGNPQRFVSPLERSLDFTLKCKSGAKRENIGLVRTSDLFRVCKIVLEKNDSEFAEKCRKAIHNQLGEIIVFPQYE